MAYPSNSNTSQNSELFSALVTAAQYAAYENSVARQMVTVFDAPYNTGKSLQVPIWTGITAELLTDEQAPTLRNTNTTSATITLDEHVLYHQVTDRLRDSAYNDVMAQIGDQSGRAIAEGMDKQVFDLFTSFSTDLGPGAGASLSVTDLLKAAATLRSAKLTGPFFAVLHPKQAYDVKEVLIKTIAYNGSGAVNNFGANPSNAGNRVLDAFYIGQIAGIQVFESGLISVDGSGDAIGAVFAGSAIGHAMRGTIEMETQRQAAARATDVVVKAYAGAAILQNSHGVKLTSDATL